MNLFNHSSLQGEACRPLNLNVLFLSDHVFLYHNLISHAPGNSAAGHILHCSLCVYILLILDMVGEVLLNIPSIG